MRIPENVLGSLSSKSKDENYKYRNLYRNLYNPNFFLNAYAKIAPKVGNMTEGVDSQTIDGMSNKRIESIIETLKDESYQPNPSKRIYIDKKNSKDKRPLGIPSTNDKLVQEIVRSILEAIYDESFSDKSHGFRSNRSCHTALSQISRTFAGVRWFVEGDIKGFFDNIDHQILVKILRKRIDDEKFIRLIWKFLKAGYMEGWKYNNTYSGTPQGGIISPILSNIYLNELDMYIEEFTNKFNKGKERKLNPEYRRLCSRAGQAVSRLKIKENEGRLTEEEKQEKLAKIKEWKEEALSMPATNDMDESFKRISYVRYADDFLIGVIGSKEDARQIKAELTKFLKDELKLELSEEKTLITHSDKGAKFLGYEILIGRDPAIKKLHGYKRRTTSYTVYLKLPKEKWMGKLLDLNAMVIQKDGKWKPVHRKFLTNLDALEIVSTYNSEIRGLYNYYKLANNVSVLNQFHYIMEYSMYKTFASKYKMSVRQIINKHKIDGKFAVRYKVKDKEHIRYFYNEGFNRVLSVKKVEDIDTIPNTSIYHGRNGLIDRLNAGICEWCGDETDDIEIHHVRKLKDLKGKKKWEEIMIARNRKTLAMCLKCHNDLHKGRLD